MQTLKEMNVDKSLKLLEDFVRSVPAGDLDESLRGKKVQAELALAHFGELFRDEDEHLGSDCCHAGQKSQDRSGPPS